MRYCQIRWKSRHIQQYLLTDQPKLARSSGKFTKFGEISLDLAEISPEFGWVFNLFKCQRREIKLNLSKSDYAITDHHSHRIELDLVGSFVSVGSSNPLDNPRRNQRSNFFKFLEALELDSSRNLRLLKMNVHPIQRFEEWKSGRIEKILISLLFVWLGVEKWRDGKKNKFIEIYSYTLIKK